MTDATRIQTSSVSHAPKTGLLSQTWQSMKNRRTGRFSLTAVNRKSAGTPKSISSWGFGAESCFLSQDTVVALQALSTFAAVGGSHEFDVNVSVETEASTAVASFHIHQDNYLLQQSQQVAEPDGEMIC